MPNDNRISATLSDTDKTAVLNAFKLIKDKLPFLINLTPAERRSIPSLGTARGGMDEAFATAIAAHPELVPSYVDAEEMELDRTLWLQLAEIRQLSAEISEGIEDTCTVAGSDTYLAYLSFYQNVKQAAKRNVTGADAIYQNLRRFFPKGGRGTQSTPPTP